MHNMHFHQHTSLSNMIYNLHVREKKNNMIRKRRYFCYLFVIFFSIQYKRLANGAAPHNIVALERLGLVHAY